MILYINSCVRKGSRTNRLAKALLAKLGAYEELRLTDMGLMPLDEKSLEYRETQILKQNFNDDIFELSKQFAKADIIVISAPYWDGNFPAVLKTYLENIYSIGIVTTYDENGKPKGLCKAKKLYYVSTAGGVFNPRFSYDYTDSLVKNIFGIPETKLIYAENLDIVGYDAEAIMAEAIRRVEP